MSNDKPSSSSKRKLRFSIEPVRVTDQDQASVKRVLGRLTGRVPFPEADAPTAHDAGDTHSTGSTRTEGSTQLTGSTYDMGTTEIIGSTHLTDSTSSGDNAPQSEIAHDTGITHPTGTTLATGTTHRQGSAYTARPEIQEGGTSQVPVSPERDFQKVPNSITREMASRLFRGKSKQLYDYLWSQSRGAISPTRTVRRSRPQLLRGAGFGSMGTVERCVDFLSEVGLIKVRTIVGESEGNEYEVFTPEEVAPALLGLPSLTGTTYPAGITGSTLKQVIPVLPETGNTGSTLSPIESTASGEPKTSFKTTDEKTDDEAFAKFLAAVRKASAEITGREPAAAEAARWGELAELLIMELKIAAGRTTVSSVPAFLTEHLRRRLWKKERRQVEEEGRSVSGSQPAFAKEDTSKCPDCFGTGMYYPEGFDKGVARCAHQKLTNQAEKEE